MSRQIRKGPTLPPGREPDAILTGAWLARQLGRPLRAAEAQTFGRMVLDAWREQHGMNYQPYTMRVGEDSSQKTVYLPEDAPILFDALHRYRNSKSYKRIQAEIRKENRHDDE